MTAVDCAPDEDTPAPWRIALYEAHYSSLNNLANARRDAIALKAITHTDINTDVRPEGVSQALLEASENRPTDRFVGDARLRTMNALLSMIDENGFERSNHQMQFHDAFIRACSRVLYREEWPVHRSAIMQHNAWVTAPSEIMVSTPRRFGKTFSVAMFCVCMALTFPVEIVVFSPARRASRKILERMREFAGTLGMSDRVIEYNQVKTTLSTHHHPPTLSHSPTNHTLCHQENLRMSTIQGGTSLIRSFPSKVSVSLTPRTRTPRTHTHTHTRTHTHTMGERRRGLHLITLGNQPPLRARLRQQILHCMLQL
jgi:hypothetical protein